MTEEQRSRLTYAEELTLSYLNNGHLWTNDHLMVQKDDNGLLIEGFVAIKENPCQVIYGSPVAKKTYLQWQRTHRFNYDSTDSVVLDGWYLI